LTNYKLCFIPSEETFLYRLNLRSDYFTIPLPLIKKFKKQDEKKKSTVNTVQVTTKCGRGFIVIFSSETNKEFDTFYKYIQNFVPIKDVKTNFAFNFHTAYNELEKAQRGWRIYDIDKEFTR